MNISKLNYQNALYVYFSVAYIMSVSHLSWRDALRVVRVGRKIANPNSGFQLQLQDYEHNRVDDERRRMKERYPSLASKCGYFFYFMVSTVEFEI